MTHGGGEGEREEASVFVGLTERLGERITLGLRDVDVKVYFSVMYCFYSIQEILPTPWRAIFTSAPFWACVVAEICSTYTAYTLQTSLPAFMKESLKFDIKQV